MNSTLGSVVPLAMFWNPFPPIKILFLEKIKIIPIFSIIQTNEKTLGHLILKCFAIFNPRRGVRVGQSFTNQCPSSCPLFFVDTLVIWLTVTIFICKFREPQFVNLETFLWKFVNSIHPINEICVRHIAQFATLQCILCNFHNLVVCDHNLFANGAKDWFNSKLNPENYFQKNIQSIESTILN